MEFAFNPFPWFNPADFVLRALVVFAIGIVLLLGFILGRRAHRNRYFRHRAQRTIEIRRLWRGIVDGKIQPEAWCFRRLDREIVESLLLDRLEVAAAVKSAYADLVRLDRTASILGETRSILEDLVQATRRRYEVGQGIQESVLKTQTEVLRLEAELARVSQDRRAAEVRLDAAVGRPEDVPIGEAILFPEGALPETPDSLADAAVAASPEIGAMAASVKREEAGVALAREEEKPDFIWSAAYMNRGGLDPMVMGMFGVRLPLYRDRKQAAAVLQRQSELEAARQDLSAAELRARAGVRELVSRVQRAERLLLLFGEGVLPQAKSTLESARASYDTGRIGFLDLLNDVTVVLNTRIEIASQEAERVQALAALEPLLGRELIRPASGSGEEGGGHADLR